MTSPKNPDTITLLVFKDQQASRTFQIPLKWLNQLGFTALFLLGISVTSVLFGTRMLTLYLRSGNASVDHLEKQIQQLKSDKEALEQKISTSNATPPPASSLTAHSPTTPEPQAAVPAPLPPSSTAPTSWIAATFFPKTTSVLAPQSAAPIVSSQPKFTWTNKVLKVDFNLQYVAADGGPQQGRIIILARGPSAVFAHPTGALNLPGADTFITPSKGEYFSVSRFREVNVEFPINKSDNLVTTLEVIILNTEGKILIYQTYPIAAAPAKPAATPVPAKAATPAQAKPAKAPKASSSEIIEPGVDQ